ncbi:hypothetical protein J8F10_08760 [Gemmata sp. G18]|uniref:DNA-binding domain-containing protein n=1 Tax=Gemmata palustris TaxID=2822762 RepID=A0ABS5BNV8_9BACT|nr:hypothetical protein [Gemmata palustris]MBP3955369.1 hypothetical protein [Gemmata palustris]
MAEEYTRDELVRALQREGARLLRDYFKPDPDLEALIKNSVGANTFRSFQKMAKPPSEVFRGWAKSRLSYSVMEAFGAIEDQVAYDAFFESYAADLTRYWEAEGKRPLKFGPGRKLLDLLFKRITCCTEVPAESRQLLIPLLHVPLDEFSLTAVRQCAASEEFGEPIDIPAAPSMGWVTSPELYANIQALMRHIAATASVPTICLDLLAWDHAHS